MWNSLSGSQPFLRHEFLQALEDSGSVGAGTGWSPEPLALYQHGTLIGTVPLYRKRHSYGEYVFDWAWAQAYGRAGLNYYPKLVAAVPFTPVTGPRLLAGPNGASKTLTETAVQAICARAQATCASSVHWLFPSTADCVRLAEAGLIRRTGFQFHWENRGWTGFADYLEAFSAPKRKNIKRERRAVAEACVQYTVHEGQAVSETLWDDFYDLYLTTIFKYGGTPYLTREFFSRIGATVPGIVLVHARRGQESIAAALFFRDQDTLYGRYWGTRRELSGLHFETCYYQAIDYCLAHGLNRFEAGAQGGHKLSRGFLPTPTYSMHWLDHHEFQSAVADFLDRENAGLEITMHELNEHSPFRAPS